MVVDDALARYEVAEMIVMPSLLQFLVLLPLLLVLAEAEMNDVDDNNNGDATVEISMLDDFLLELRNLELEL